MNAPGGFSGLEPFAGGPTIMTPGFTRIKALKSGLG